MQRGNLTRLCVLGVLILGGIEMISCSAAGGTPITGSNPAVAIPTASLIPFPNNLPINTEASHSISCDNVSISNPAAAYCSMLGYQTGMQDTDAGQVGICALPDGTVCDAWQFLRGKCGQEYSFCALQGYGIETVTESDGASTQEYAVCVDSNGNILGSLIELSGLQALLDACSLR